MAIKSSYCNVQSVDKDCPASACSLRWSRIMQTSESVGRRCTSITLRFTLKSRNTCDDIILPFQKKISAPQMTWHRVCAVLTGVDKFQNKNKVLPRQMRAGVVNTKWLLINNTKINGKNDFCFECKPIIIPVEECPQKRSSTNTISHIQKKKKRKKGKTFTVRNREIGTV